MNSLNLMKEKDSNCYIVRMWYKCPSCPFNHRFSVKVFPRNVPKWSSYSSETETGVKATTNECWKQSLTVFLFQSIIDFFASVVLLMSSLTLENTGRIHSKGILGELECRLWNTEFFLWALFCASTWNIVAMTIERYLSPQLNTRRWIKIVSQ